MNAKAVALLDRAQASLLLLCAVALPLGFYLKTYDPLLIKDLTLQLAATVSVALWLSRSLEAGRFELAVGRGLLAGLAAAALALTLLSLGWNPYAEVSLLGALRQASLLALFLVALLGPASTGWAASLADWTVAGAGLAAAYGLAQWAGLDPAPWRDAFGGAAFSTLGGPTALGVLMAAAWPLAAARAVDDEATGPRRAAALLAGILSLGAACACGSPVALAAFAVGSAAFAARTLSASLDSRLRTLALGQAALTAAALAAAPWALQDERWLAARRVLAATWQASSDMLSFRVFQGWGAGSFPAVFPDFRPPELARWLPNAAQLAHPGSEPLRLIVELGLVGLLLFAALAIVILIPAWRDGGDRLRDGDTRSGALSAACWASCAALLAAGLISDGLSSAPPAFLLATLGAALAAMAREDGSATVYVLPIPAPPLARLALARLAALGAVVLAFGSAAFWAADLELNQATLKAKNGDVDAAVSDLQRVWLRHPRGASARFFAARLLAKRNQRGDAEAALTLYQDSERLDPGLPQVSLRAAEAQIRLADWSGAEASLERGLRRDPFAAESWEKLVEVKWILGKKDEARIAALGLIKADPNNPERWRLLARTYRELKQPAVARAMERKASRLVDLARTGSLPPIY